MTIIFRTGAANEEEIAKIREYTFSNQRIAQRIFPEEQSETDRFKIEFGNYNGDVILADEISPIPAFVDADTNEKWIKIDSAEIWECGRNLSGSLSRSQITVGDPCNERNK
jgi:phosphoribosylaminoimidazole-succinocarboxamide synthase